ncbi:hypothetical protein ACFSTD_04640 [Novosphingobium colocasiae]
MDRGGADLWWLLYSADKKLACAFPQGAAGETAMIEFLFALPGFDHAEMTLAMRSTDNATFMLWQKAPDSTA